MPERLSLSLKCLIKFTKTRIVSASYKRIVSVKAVKYRLHVHVHVNYS